ncbi:hypothetical protein M1146_04355 [Patescibacteria group bacterium]|nr:hypothetical protein [Patescibacteria group bacterium]
MLGSGLLPHSPNQVTNLNPLPGYIQLFHLFVRIHILLFRINNVNQAKPATTPSGPLDYRKLPNPTKGFGDKAQRRITTLMTPKYETQTGSPLPRAESEYVVCSVIELLSMGWSLFKPLG